MSMFGRPTGKYTRHPLKAELEHHGLTQQAAADYCKVSRARMCHFLNGSPPHGARPGRLPDLLNEMFQPLRDEEARVREEGERFRAERLKAQEIGAAIKLADQVEEKVQGRLSQQYEWERHE